jgi:hypothetical protein
MDAIPTAPKLDDTLVIAIQSIGGQLGYLFAKAQQEEGTVLARAADAMMIGIEDGIESYSLGPYDDDLAESVEWEFLHPDQKNGAVLRIRRMDAGLTQVELGKLVGVSCATISRWEMGDQYPPTEAEWRKVSAILNDLAAAAEGGQ